MMHIAYIRVGTVRVGRYRYLRANAIACRYIYVYYVPIQPLFYCCSISLDVYIIYSQIHNINIGIVY